MNPNRMNRQHVHVCYYFLGSLFHHTSAGHCSLLTLVAVVRVHGRLSDLFGMLRCELNIGDTYILFGVARDLPPEVALVEIARATLLNCERATPERHIGDDRNAKLARSGKYADLCVLDVEIEWRVL